MKIGRPLSTRFVALLSLAVLAGVPEAGSQVASFALTAKEDIDLEGNSIIVDSFDSLNPNYSTDGRYDPAKRKANGDVASTEGFINLQNAAIMGTLYTGPDGSIAMGPQGTVGDLAWVLGGQTGVQPGHYRNDLSIAFPDVQPPYSLGFPPAGRTIGTNYYTWYLGYNNYMCVNPGGVTFHSGDKVMVEGRARVYVTGDFIMQPGSIMTIVPGARLELYVGGTTTSLSTINNAGNCGSFMYFGLTGNQALTLSGNEVFLGCIYAPSAELALSGGGNNMLDFQGACAAKSITVTGHCSFHYDENLGGSRALPRIVIQPQSQVVTVGQPAAFTPVVVGAFPLSYQWRLNGTNIPAATNASYTVTNAQPDDAGVYSLALTNYFGSATSSNAVLTVNVPPTLELRLPADCPLLSLSGMLSSNFVVQYSTNLAGTNWLNLVSLTNLPSSPYLFVDPAGGGEPARFYRAFMQ